MSLYCPECQASYADESLRICPQDGTRLYQVDRDDPLIGGVIDGRFRVDYTLGVGGMGTVYGGVQLSVNRDVAIKVLRTELSNREVALERFFREAKTISQLTHPNIVKLVDFGQDRDRGLLYLVMELVQGSNLADLIDEGRLRASLALEIVYQVCGALTEPHANGVIHRDLKPDNLLLKAVSDDTAQVKVLDFGIARFMESNTQLTGTGMICGTPAYMAPEQAQNETLDDSTDLYALGVILYEMLSGWPPFSGTSSLQIMLKHIQENPPRLRDLLPPATLPDSIETLVYDLMSKQRRERPKSAREVRKRIDEIRKELGLEPVRLDPTRSAPFDEWVLPKLPRPDREKSGPTQVLRRETDLEQAVLTGAAPAADSEAEVTPGEVPGAATALDAPASVTAPFTPDQRQNVMSDGVKVDTREGGQQAWTPGDQRAVRSIKDTKDGVDVLGATVDVASAERRSAGQPRRTLVESDNSAQIVGEPPETGDSIPSATASPDRTLTKEREEVATPGGRANTNVPLVLVALLACAGAIGAAFYVVQKIETVAAAKPAETTQLGTPNLAEPDPTPAAATDPTQLAEFVRASHLAQRKVHDGLSSATETATAPAHKPLKPKPTAKNRPVAPAEKVDSKAKPPPEPDQPKATDAIVESLLKDAPE